MYNFTTPLIPKADMPQIVMPRQTRTALIIIVPTNIFFGSQVVFWGDQFLTFND